MIEILVKALWVTLLTYILFVIIRMIYRRYFKSEAEGFFYFKALKIEGDNSSATLSIQSPEDDFAIEIRVIEEGKELYKKNARLKAGINFLDIPLSASSSAQLILQSENQKVERYFVEAEV